MGLLMMLLGVEKLPEKLGTSLLLQKINREMSLTVQVLSAQTLLSINQKYLGTA